MMWFFKWYYRILSKLDTIEDSIVHNDYKKEILMLSSEVNVLSTAVADSIIAQNAAIAALNSLQQEVADLMAKLDLNSDDTAKMAELTQEINDARTALIAATPVAPVVPVA
jgi:hypothetical protein